jgi:hypothetical protein
MITDAVVTTILGAVNALLALIPSVSFDWASASGMGTLIQTANVFFPVSEAFALIRTVVSWGSGLVMAWVIYRLIDWLPFT